jgi:hypothetical protein
MTGSLSEQINFEGKKEKTKKGSEDKPKPFPEDAPKRYHSIYKKKYTNKDKFMGFKVIDKLRKLLD